MKYIIDSVEVTAKNGTKGIINNSGKLVTEKGTFDIDLITHDNKVQFFRDGKLVEVQLVDNAETAKAILSAKSRNAVLVNIEKTSGGEFDNCGREFIADNTLVCYQYK